MMQDYEAPLVVKEWAGSTDQAQVYLVRTLKEGYRAFWVPDGFGRAWGWLPDGPWAQRLLVESPNEPVWVAANTVTVPDGTQITQVFLDGPGWVDVYSDRPTTPWRPRVAE